jgi:Holliday junction resolvase
MRLRAKRDESEKLIVAALRKLGWSVEFLSIPNGPDLLAGRDGFTTLIEVKTGKGKLKPGQVTWHANWRGAPVQVIRDVAAAIEYSVQAKDRRV